MVIDMDCHRAAAADDDDIRHVRSVPSADSTDRFAAVVVCAAESVVQLWVTATNRLRYCR